MEPTGFKEHLFQKIETLRRQLHLQNDFTERDTLEVSTELDRLILKAMKKDFGKTYWYYVFFIKI